MANKSKHHWAETFHGKLTFWGVFNSYYEECSSGWNADTTKASYQSAYENKILPSLKSHDYESRNEFLNEDKRYRISQKMAQRPLVNDLSPIREVQINPGTRVSLKPNEKYVITGNAGRIRIHTSGKEPADKIKLSIQSTPQNLYIHKETEISEKKQDLIERQIDIIKKYHERYM